MFIQNSIYKLIYWGLNFTTQSSCYCCPDSRLVRCQLFYRNFFFVYFLQAPVDAHGLAFYSLTESFTTFERTGYLRRLPYSLNISPGWLDTWLESFSFSVEVEGKSRTYRNPHTESIFKTIMFANLWMSRGLWAAGWRVNVNPFIPSCHLWRRRCLEIRQHIYYNITKGCCCRCSHLSTRSPDDGGWERNERRIL